MRHEFCMQDPTDPGTIYLFDAIIEALDGAKEGMGIFAFASRQGVEALLLNDDMARFLRRGTFDLIVGMDAVTNRPTLEYLQRLDGEIANLTVRVFWNRRRGLFHPKIVRFTREDGSGTAIVGSGNLTPGGLWDNYEAYSVISAETGEDLGLTSWDSFVARHARNIRLIDERALERASRNFIRGGQGHEDIEPDIVSTEETLADDETEEGLPEGRVLVAQMPRGGGRWNQGHFNDDVARQYFRVEPGSNLRVYLTAVAIDGSVSPQEVRKVRKDASNRNVRIELGARRGTPYPNRGVPIAVFREDQARRFRYLVLMPGEQGHSEMLWLTENLDPVGRGLPRVICDAANVRSHWPECPIL